MLIGLLGLRQVRAAIDGSINKTYLRELGNA